MSTQQTHAGVRRRAAVRLTTGIILVTGCCILAAFPGGSRTDEGLGTAHGQEPDTTAMQVPAERHEKVRDGNVSVNAYVSPESETSRRRAGPGSLSTGFEPGDGFAPGPIHGQAGWIAFVVTHPEGHIDTVNPATGSQHLRISKDPALPTGTNTGAFSPDLGPLATGPSTTSVDVSISAINGADYIVVGQSPSEGFLTWRVDFGFLGSIFVVDDIGAGLAFVDTGTTWTVGAYQNLTVCDDPAAGTTDYYYNGALIYSQVTHLPGTRVEQVVLFSDNFHLTDDGDFDNLAIQSGLSGACASGPTTTIEVDVDGTITPLDKAVVPTAKPRIIITRAADVPAAFTVLLTREDGRAGFGGLGKSISVGPPGSGADLEETGVGTNVFQGSIEVLTGLNTIRIQPEGGGSDLLTGTMLNYTNDYEDVNGNGVLDTGEDLNHDGVLDLGEDVNGNGTLELDEDFNDNGILDPGEDINANEYLDLNEDFNANGQLDTDEDLNDDGILDEGEDLNGNGILDADVAFPIGAMFDDTMVVISPEGVEQQAVSVIIEFVGDATDVQITQFFQQTLGTNPFDLQPKGLLVDTVDPGRPLIVTAEILDGTAPHVVERTLNGLGPGDPIFPPPAPPAFPILVAFANLLDTDFPTVLGENLPARLRNGVAPNAGEGYENGAPGTGGFDNDGNAPDELDIAWQHFFIQTYAAHRLLGHLPVAGAPTALAIVDSGFGNGVNNNLPDIVRGRFVRVTDIPTNGRNLRLSQVPDNVFPGLGHGTSVASYAAGDGTSLVLGTGNRVPVRPIRLGNVPSTARQLTAYTVLGLDANTAVVNISIGWPIAAANANAGQLRVIRRRFALRRGIAAMAAQNQIVVLAAGNASEITERAYPAVFAVQNLAGTAIDDDGDGATDEDGSELVGPPVNNDGDVFPVGHPLAGRPRLDEDPAELPMMLAVAATGVANLPRGPELAAAFSNFGQRISISAPGQAVIGVRPNRTFTGPRNGTSFAAPMVAGAIAELINTATALPAGLFSGGGVTVAQRRLRVAQIVLATADDLGTMGGAPFTNNDAGDGPEIRFGIGGRLNMWKAALSVANQGLSAQHARDTAGGAPNGFDDRFTSLPTKNDANTLWYGFEIITSERQATVWIDGTQQKDAGAAMPLAPNITAYKGVRSDLRIERGVHNLTDGSGNDPTVAGPPARPGQIVEEDPTSGIVPVGTRAANKGQYVTTFSIERKDLFEDDGAGNPDTSKPKTLSLRRRGKGVDDRPIFNLRLETTKMRSGEVSGVTFDDFVFQIVAPDYGDAKIAPTLMNAENGARHENTHLEWLGKLNPATDAIPNLKSVSAEHNADPETVGGDPRVDVDGVDNRLDFHDRDGRDDGVLFFPLTFVPNTSTGNTEFTVGVFDHLSPRYSADVDKSLYVNLWIDWDADGTWEEGATKEHVIDGLRLNPQNATWIEDQGASGSLTFFDEASADGDRAQFDSFFDVPDIKCGLIWARVRLDYGENVGRNDPLPQFKSLPSLRSLANPPVPGLVGGAARYGEVEDYLIGTDFGDAPDPFDGPNVNPAGPGKYPTLKANMGARHLDVHQEWLGPDNDTRPDPSREIDANDPSCAGAGTDEDLKPNLVDEDSDNGVVIHPFLAGEVFAIDVTVTSSISARGSTKTMFARDVNRGVNFKVGLPEDEADTLPRYNSNDAKRRLYLSGWADWNGDGVWATPGEKIINDIIDPESFGPDGIYTLGEIFIDENKNGVYDGTAECPQPDGVECYYDDFGIDTETFTYFVQAPEGIKDKFWFRFRLAYGEDETTVDLKVKENDEVGRNNNEEKGGALFGEVEDYPRPELPPDWHATWVEFPTDTVVDFAGSGLTIPADFFGSGSEPLTSTVPMRGLPPTDDVGDSSVCFQRDRDPVLTDIAPIDTVSLDVTVLSLVSAQPVVVTYNNRSHSELWELRVGLSPSSIAPQGSLTATKTHDNGGTFESTFYIQPLLKFTRLSDGLVAELDTGSGRGTAPLEFRITGDFVHDVDPSLDVFMTAGANWVSGIKEVAGVQSVVPMIAETTDVPPTVTHMVCPPRDREVDYFPNSSATVDITSAALGSETVTLTGPTMVIVDLGSLGDNDEDGLEEVPTEMVELSLSGTSTLFGPITLRLRPTDAAPFLPTIGEIEEKSNDTVDTLDLPPFTLEGAAASYFDVFFEIEVGGEILHNIDPKHVETQITEKPPAEGETYEENEVIPLYDEAGTITDVELGNVYHTPRPQRRPDPHRTEPGLGISSTNFGNEVIPAISADFFGAGSDPFTGDVAMEGVPLDPTDPGTSTLIVRSADPIQPSDPLGTQGTVEVELVALSLKSIDPITVTFNGGQDPELWDVKVGLSDVPVPPGSLTATKEHANGGTFVMTLPVNTKLTFTKTDNPSEVRVLDSALEGIEPIQLATQTPAPWVHALDATLEGTIQAPFNGVFVPGVREGAGRGADAANSVKRPVETSSATNVRANQQVVSDTQSDAIGNVRPRRFRGGALPADARAGPGILGDEVFVTVCDGPFTINGNETIIPAGGVECRIDILIAGWDAADPTPGLPRLAAYQATLVGTSLLGANASPPNPGVDLTPLAAFITVNTCTGGSADGQSCDTHADCPGGVCVPNPDFVLTDGNCFGPITAVSAPPDNNIVWVGVCQGGGVPDPGVPKVAGSLRFDVPANAQGTYTIQLNPDPNQTLWNDENGVPIPGLGVTSGLLTIASTGACCLGDACFDDLDQATCELEFEGVFQGAGTTCADVVCGGCTDDAECDDGDACTDDFCDNATGECVNGANYDVTAQCCDPATGVVTVINDGDPCTDDLCDAATGAVSHVPVPDGTVCDDIDQCTTNDVCVGGLCSGQDINGLPCDTNADCPPPGNCDDNGQCVCGGPAEQAVVPILLEDPVAQTRHSITPSPTPTDVVPPALASAPHDGPKSRYISFDPNNGATPVAFQVTLSDGRICWAGEPFLISDVNNIDPQWVAACVSSANNGADQVRNWSSYTDPATGDPVVHLRGCVILPDETYDVRTMAVGGALTAPLTIGTTPAPTIAGSWADCVGNFDPDSGKWGPPDGNTSFKDIAAGVQGFQQLETAPASWIDLAPFPEQPNYIINFSDIGAIIQGFQSTPYPGSVVDCVIP